MKKNTNNIDKAVFLDRDGVINIDNNYVNKIEDFEFKDGIFESLIHLQKLGYRLFIITNQSGIGRGYYTLQDFRNLMSWVLKKFEEKNIYISQIEFCPHHPNLNCDCRKPKTGMIENILKNYSIDLKNSWLIGDKNSDIQCGINSKIKNTILIRPKNSKVEGIIEAKHICISIKDIKEIIKK